MYRGIKITMKWKENFHSLFFFVLHYSLFHFSPTVFPRFFSFFSVDYPILILRHQSKNYDMIVTEWFYDFGSHVRLTYLSIWMGYLLFLLDVSTWTLFLLNFYVEIILTFVLWASCFSFYSYSLHYATHITGIKASRLDKIVLENICCAARDGTYHFELLNWMYAYAYICDVFTVLLHANSCNCRKMSSLLPRK